MRKKKLLFGSLAILLSFVAIFLVLQNEKSVVFHPKGPIAKGELTLIVTNIALMLIVVIPTFIALLVVILKYRSTSNKGSYEPDKKHGFFSQLVLWIIPSLIIAVMIIVTLKATHKLDPYKPIESEIEPITIQVLALDWKWLFIYPEEGIASVNFVQFPEKTPIHFKLAADGSPMNSFWIPNLSGQIYAMTGMITPLYILADERGEYPGRAAEINGDGYSGMTFLAKSCSEEEYDKWISLAKQSPLKLNQENYLQLTKRSEHHPIEIYSSVEDDLFNKVVMKYLQIKTPIGILWKTFYMENSL